MIAVSALDYQCHPGCDWRSSPLLPGCANR